MKGIIKKLWILWNQIYILLGIDKLEKKIKLFFEIISEYFKIITDFFEIAARKKYFYPLLYLFLACVCIALPFFLDDPAIGVLNFVGLYAILALSLNLILGYAGLFHMGHGAFYAVGAYLPAILIVNLHIDIPILWLLPLCGLSSGAFALMVARPIIHLRGDYLLIVTIALVEIVKLTLVNDFEGVLSSLGLENTAFFNSVFNEGDGLTGGDNGIRDIPRPIIGIPGTDIGYTIKSPFDFYYLIWAFVAFTVFIFYRLENSRIGRALRYIKEDEVAAEGCGINTTYYKLVAFVLGAIWAGMAGNFFAAYMNSISPKSFDFEMSVKIFTIVLIGGAGSIHGVILGAFLIIGIPELFRGLAEYRMLFFGLVMVAMMLFRNKGLFPPLLKKYSIPK